LASPRRKRRRGFESGLLILFPSRCIDAGRRHARDEPYEGSIMRISARNQIKGTVVEVKKGATTSHVLVDIGNGHTITSSITNEAVDELGIKAKGHVTVVVKASDVMIGVD
jgi:molybdopterin-binding protein